VSAGASEQGSAELPPALPELAGLVPSIAAMLLQPWVCCL